MVANEDGADNVPLLRRADKPSSSAQRRSICCFDLYDCWDRLTWIFHSQPFTAAEEAKFNELKVKSSIRYDKQNPEHEGLLFLLWNLAYPESPLETTKDPRWKELGFQSNDPSTDFRGGGLFSLENMCYFAEHYTEDFRAMVRTKTDFLFAASAINVTFMLVMFFKISNSHGPGTVAQPASDRIVKGFAELLTTHENAFQETYCLCIKMLFQTWLDYIATREEVTLLDFPEALKDTQVELKSIMERRPKNLFQLRSFAPSHLSNSAFS
eukprot:GILK01005998.1.p1 GENE.GILK01005998.1~~GILK01005998.1.p1  ORF type:complete len:268 (+),score=35.55 GILK01005998.1:134-937(+)